MAAQASTGAGSLLRGFFVVCFCFVLGFLVLGFLGFSGFLGFFRVEGLRVYGLGPTP